MTVRNDLAWPLIHVPALIINCGSIAGRYEELVFIIGLFLAVFLFWIADKEEKLQLQKRRQQRRRPTRRRHIRIQPATRLSRTYGCNRRELAGIFIIVLLPAWLELYSPSKKKDARQLQDRQLSTNSDLLSTNN